MLQTLLVILGGAIGSALRYHVGKLAGHLAGTGWPWGTLSVNVAGGFVMGLLAGWLALRGGTGGENIRLFAGVGLLGGFTTFSAFSLDVVQVLERGEMLSALAYILASVILAVGALALGLTIMRGALA